MKTIFTFIITLAIYCQTYAQGDMYGTIYRGGAMGQGAIYKTDSNGLNYEVIHEFEIDENIYTTAKQKLIEINGKMYGIGKPISDTCVVIFSYDLTTKVYQIEYRSTLDIGRNPLSSLCKTSGGKYFFTTTGGANNYGTLVEYDPTTQTAVKKLDFVNEITGYTPSADLVEGANGDLYGTTMNGGDYSSGTIFRYSVSGDSIEVVASFDATATGKTPQSTLLKANNGLYYSFTSRGGTNDQGTFYSFNSSTKQITKIADFDNTNGAYPSNNSLFQTSNGKIYGITGGGSSGGGQLLEYTISTNAWVNKLNFSSNSNASRPQTGFVELPNGNLLFTSRFGKSYGTVMEYNPSNNSVLLVASLDEIGTGTRPQATLSLGSNGKYYFLTSDGGRGTRGGLVELDYSTKKLTGLKHFGESPEGRFPNDELTMGTNGKLYGITLQGADGAGVIFSIDPKTDKYKVEQKLSKEGGSAAVTKLIEADPNNFYFCTSGGGINGRGTVKKWDATTKEEKTIGNFTYLNAYSATSDLTKGIDGNLYGVCNSGGDNNKGVLYKIDTKQDTLLQVASFYNNGPIQPQTKLVALSNGNFLSTSFNGGDNNLGTIFEYDATLDSIVILVHLTDSIGRGGNSGFTRANNGKYYTYFGSTSNPTYPGGTLIEYDYITKKMEIKGGNRTAISGKFSATHSDFHLATNGRLYGIVEGISYNSPIYLAEYNVADDSLSFIMTTKDRLSGLVQSMPSTQNTSIKNLSQKSTLIVYPNPTQDNLTIVNNHKAVKNIKVLSLMGATVMEIDGSKNTIDVSNLTNGIYLIQVNYSNSIGYSRFIKE